MNRFIDLIKRNPSFIAYTIFAALILAAFVRSDQAREDGRRDACISSLDNSLAIRDIIDLSGGRTTGLPAERQAIIDAIYARIELPPRVCQGTSIDVQSYFTRETSTTTTTTTTVGGVGMAPATTGTSSVTATTAEASRSPPAPRGPVPAPDRMDPPTSTTTAPPGTTTTTTTQPPFPEDECTVQIQGVCIVDIPLFTGSGIFPFLLFGI